MTKIINRTSGTFTGVFSGDATLAATNKLYLDGGGDTYLTESSANVVDMVVQDRVVGQWDGSTVTDPKYYVGESNAAVTGSTSLYIRSAARNCYVRVTNSTGLMTFNPANTTVGFQFVAGGSPYGTWKDDGLRVNALAHTTGAPHGVLECTGYAHTGRTASTELNMIYFNLGQTVTWATGALADQRCIRVAAPTLAFAGASTVTTASTVYIDNAPQAGANATLTNAYALHVDAGQVQVDEVVVTGVGYQATSTAVTATADGLTTGLIAANTSVVSAAAGGSANNIITLPAPVVGMQIRVYTDGTGCEMRTVAASGQTINNVDSDGTNELALAADSFFVCECISATAWIVRGFDNVGADLAALVPDAA